MTNGSNRNIPIDTERQLQGELETAQAERIDFFDTHTPPYTEAQQAELDAINELVLDASKRLIEFRKQQ